MLIPATHFRYDGDLSRFSFTVPDECQPGLWSLCERAASRGALVDVEVTLPHQPRSRRSENLLYPTARAWWISLGLDNVRGWELAKLRFGVSMPWHPGFKKPRAGAFVEYEDRFYFVASEATYSQQEVSDMIDRIRSDAGDRGVVV